MKPDQPIILNRQRKHAVSRQRLELFIETLCQRLRIPQRQFTVVLTNDPTMRRFNQRFRHKDQTTDVLSFPCSPHEPKLDPFPLHYLGDMIISVETAYRQAIQRGHSLEKEIDILVIHGLLHLLGYDHETDDGQMHRRERRLQRDLLC
ncbi:MAG: rRNA maturation RNase YbeY [Terriglobia bacterium]